MHTYFNRLNIIPLILSILWLTSCRSTSKGGSESADGTLETRPLADAGSQAGTINLDPSSRGLANGWDSELHRKFAPCLETDFLYRGAQASDLTFMRDFTYEQILKETGAGLYGKASLLGLVSAKVKGEMATSLASTDESASFIYNFSLLGKSAVLSERRFNINGSAAYNTGNLVHFREECGDQFVEQVRLGGQLYIGVKYTFASKEIKEKIRIKATLSLFWGLVKISKTWSKEIRDMMKDVRISIEAYQVGGDPRKLQALKDKIYKGSCAGDQPEECVAAVDQLLDYGAKDFADQLQNMTLSNDPYAGPAIVDLALENYNSLKIFDPKLKKAVQVSVTASTSPENELSVTNENLDRLKVDLKIAQDRVKILSEFKLSDADRAVVNSSSEKITAALTALDILMSSTCSRAATDSSFIESCIVRAKEMVFQGKTAIVPVALTPASP